VSGTAGELSHGSASNQYQLLARLAQGGMAEIFLARASGLAGFERYVVLKRIRPERNEDPKWVQLFLDEARLSAQLVHPNIAQVFDLGQLGDSYFYTMEYVHGVDVLEILSRCAALGQHMPVQIAIAIAVGAATGLGYAHDRSSPDGRSLGIVHRDLSPANLMVSHDGIVKVLDFGVAKSRTKQVKTNVGTIMGKVAYLSPEQCETGRLDLRSDIFSLGIVVYEMLTQFRPFKRVNDFETMQAIVRFDPPAPSAKNPHLPPEIDAVVLRALAKRPMDRYPSAHAFAEALEDVAEKYGLSLSARELKRFMRDLYGQPPEPWRELVDPEVSLHTFDGGEESLSGVRMFGTNADASEVPLLPLRNSPIGTPGMRPSATDDLDLAMTPQGKYRPVPRASTDDLDLGWTSESAGGRRSDPAPPPSWSPPDVRRHGGSLRPVAEPTGHLSEADLEEPSDVRHETIAATPSAAARRPPPMPPSVSAQMPAVRPVRATGPTPVSRPNQSGGIPSVRGPNPSGNVPTVRGPNASGGMPVARSGQTPPSMPVPRTGQTPPSMPVAPSPHASGRMPAARNPSGNVPAVRNPSGGVPVVPERHSNDTAALSDVIAALRTGPVSAEMPAFGSAHPSESVLPVRSGPLTLSMPSLGSGASADMMPAPTYSGAMPVLRPPPGATPLPAPATLLGTGPNSAVMPTVLPGPSSSSMPAFGNPSSPTGVTAVVAPLPSGEPRLPTAPRRSWGIIMVTALAVIVGGLGVVFAMRFLGGSDTPAAIVPVSEPATATPIEQPTAEPIEQPAAPATATSPTVTTDEPPAPATESPPAVTAEPPAATTEPPPATTGELTKTVEPPASNNATGATKTATETAEVPTKKPRRSTTEVTATPTGSSAADLLEKAATPVKSGEAKAKKKKKRDASGSSQSCDDPLDCQH